LANFIEVLKQSLHHQGAENTSGRLELSQEKRDGHLLNLTFDWLSQWGIPYRTLDADFRRNINPTTAPGCPQTNQHSSLGQYRQDFRQTLRDLLKGKIKLQWAKNNPPPEREKDRSSPQASQIPTSSIPPSTIPLHVSKSSSTNEKISEQSAAIPMTVQMLGKFGITIQEMPLKLHTTRGLSVLKYLLFHHKQNAPREVLMDIFWQDASPDAARNNLNVAMHNLRQAFRTVTDLAVIRFEDGTYSLAPDLEIWLDVEEFERCIKTGQHLEAQKQLAAAVIEYEIAVNLYRGDFLADTPYENWTVLDRERLRISYLDTLDHLSQIYFSQDRYAACATLCQIILNRDLCREDAHCRLMKSYSRLGQGSLALRQYQICVEALHSELEVDPAPETTRLYEQIRHHEGI
jgi:DNA-binding SARP family transcriptional activator